MTDLRELLEGTAAPWEWLSGGAYTINELQDGRGEMVGYLQSSGHPVVR